jgi:mono/diheme cytochrome c family protein
MNRHRFPVAASAATLALAAFAVLGPGRAGAAPAADAADRPAPAKPSADKVARGKYLVMTSGCHDCHTPFKMGPDGPEPDMTRMLSGHPQDLEMPPAPQLPEGPWLIVSAATNTAFSGPWGVSFTANLTPDADTGLGDWSFKNFKDTIRTGRHMGRGRPVLPPMPIPVYRNFTDRDLEAVYSYLRTIPPVKNRVPEPRAPLAAATAQK